MAGKCFLLAAAFLFACIASAADIMEAVVGKNYELFSVDRPGFINPAMSKFFVWTSDEKMSARYAAKGKSKEKLTMFGMPVAEAIVNFKENKLDYLYISLYNRGDDGELEFVKFRKKLKDAYDGIVSLTGPLAPTQRREKLADGMYLNACIWNDRRKAFFIMKWSMTGRTKKEYRPEYLQIEIEPFNENDDPANRKLVRMNRETLVNRDDLSKNLEHNKNGDVYITGIPMVDQGQKGYCVAAVAERVLAYYGCPINQHMIAQVLGTSASKGTSVDDMIKNLQKLGSKFGVKVREEYRIFDSDGDRALEQLERMVNRYNKQAKKAKKEKVEVVKKGNVFFPDETIRAMDPEIYSSLRNEDSGKKLFLKNIHTQIDAGIPVVWSVQLGILPEDGVPPQVKGGHMRLIIGYNDKNKEILYSDSWGEGHELKSMPEDFAWTMTFNTIHINPRPKRH